MKHREIRELFSRVRYLPRIGIRGTKIGGI